MAILHEGHKLTITNTYRDINGKVVVPPEAPVWSTDHPEAVMLDPSVEGLSCDVLFVSAVSGVKVASELVSVGLVDSNIIDTVVEIAPISAVSSIVSEELPL
jgi:hypothetical protein